MMKYPALLLITVVLLSPAGLSAQEAGTITHWFPRGVLYPVIRLDYKENQMAGELYALYADDRWQNCVMGLFSIGFQKSLVRWNHSPERASEVGAALTLFPQFIFDKPFEAFQTSLFNIDFQVGVYYSYRLTDWCFRGRIYHISTHLGDDFIFRGGITGFPHNPRIYEAVDLSVAWEHQPWLVYGTAGVIFHSAYERLPLLLQYGTELEVPLGTRGWLGWMAGVDVRMEQEQQFRPGIHVGTGVVLGRGGSFPVTIMADYYNGYLPYSLYDHMLVQWIGASLYLDLF